jgi:type VI secretion system FHA domain protein
MLRLTLARAGHAPGQEGISKSFSGSRVAIGRAPDNDWALPDPERHLSKTHCVIECAAGRYSITDTSTNGVFLNRSPEPLGRDNRASLKDGDRIDLGAYQIEVHIQEGDAAPDLDPFAASLAAEPDEDPFGLNRPSGGGIQPGADSGSGSPPGRAAAGSAGRGPVIPDFDDFDDLFEGLEKAGNGRPNAGPGDVFGPPPSRIEEADILGGRPRQEDWERSESDHAPSRAEFFRPPAVVSTPIPDDWDDLLPNAPPKSTPDFAEPSPAREFVPPRPELDLPLDRDPAGFGIPESTPAPEPFPVSPAVARSAPPMAAEPAPPPRPYREPVGPPDREARDSEQTPGSGTALEGFLAGAGLKLDALKLSDEEAERTMRAAGKAFRHMVEGLREVLMARSAIKNEFRVERTMIRAADNNPLKFSVSAEEALVTLLRPAVAGYLPADRAVEEALKDIKAHQLATMAGMQVAIAKLLAQFDPEELKKQLDSRSLLDSILPGSKKARYWELYEKLYQEIAKAAEEDFHGSYGREFARAYEEQVRKL